jgi:DNA repair ATPase RecN
MARGQDRLDAAADGIEALAAEREQLSWQLGEVTALGFSSEEWRALNDEHQRLAHAASLVEGAQFSLQVLAEGDAACEAQVARSPIGSTAFPNTTPRSPKSPSCCTRRRRN